MAEAIFDAMGETLARWTMGSPAAPAALMWTAELDVEPGEAELRLLALSSQFLGVAVAVEPPAGLHPLPDVPVLAMPTVSEPLRPLVRRILGAMKETRLKSELIEFLAARGWTAHPADWMPASNDEDTPDVYAPWRDWAETAASSGKRRPLVADRITAENWEDYWPAARKVALAELRRRDPAAARAVLKARLANENADARLRLLGLLGGGLSDADVALLEDIVTADRAPKVRALAAALLARLGRSPAVGEDAAELASFFSVQTKGWLKRSRAIQFENAKNPAQRQRRAVLFESVDIASLSGALQLAPEELIAAWTFDLDRQADVALVSQVARTGTDTLVAQAGEAVSQRGAIGHHGLVALAPRLAAGHRSELAGKALRIGGSSFETAKMIAGGSARLDDPLAAPAGAALLAALERADAKPSDQHTELCALGLIASRAGARQALQRLNGVGLLEGDPRLDILRLNAALDDHGAMQ